MKKISLRKGFTVLELLIIIGILCILIAMVLVGLEGARRHSRNEKKVAAIQTIVVGLAQFHDACRSYPPNFDTSVMYPCLSNQSLRILVPEIDDYRFNTPASDYYYVSLADISDTTVCTGFHVGAKLEGNEAAATSSKAGFDSNTATECDQNQGAPFNGAPGDVFDLKR